METNEELQILAEALLELDSSIKAAKHHNATQQKVAQELTLTTSSNVGTSLGSTYYTTGTGLRDLMNQMPQYIVDSAPSTQPEPEPEYIIERIDKILKALDHSEDENYAKAVKHLGFAKAYLEKSILEKLNQNL